MYPFISNLYHKKNQSKIEIKYSESVSKTDSDIISRELERARQYNQENSISITQLSEEELFELISIYEELLVIENDKIMGYIDIPKIDVSLPIYHGTSNETLENGCGHMFKSSLPVGGSSTHCVLTAHSGLANKKMFSDIDLLEIGDIIIIKVLGETLTYKVVNTKIVLPTQIEATKIIKDKDLLSLVTCTPFGINSHRLIVTSERVENLDKNNIINNQKNTITESTWKKEYESSLCNGMLMVVIICTIVILPIRHHSKIQHPTTK